MCAHIHTHTQVCALSPLGCKHTVSPALTPENTMRFIGDPQSILVTALATLIRPPCFKLSAPPAATPPPSGVCSFLHLSTSHVPENGEVTVNMAAAAPAVQVLRVSSRG